MKTNTIVLRLSVLASAIALVAACGGGGGGGGTPAATGGAISGVAAKGFLKKAKVTAYCGNSELAADLLITGVTGTAGEYSLTWTTTCTKPLLLVVELGTGTTMTDEATGTDVTPPTGFKLRALVADPSTTKIKHITPFTDMAVAIAGTSATLTKTAVSNAERAIVNTVLGGDIGAYDAEPLAPTVVAMATASVDEKKLATLLTAISAFAQDDATCKLNTTDGDKIKCATDAFAAQAMATVTAVSDTGYTVATTVPTDTPASMLAATLTKITNGTITGVTATDLSPDITSDTSGSATLLTAAEDKVTTAAASAGGTVTVDAGSASGIQAASDLFNSLKTDLLALSNGNGDGYLDQKLSAAQTDWSTNGQASAKSFLDYMTAINRATNMANEAKTATWTVTGTLVADAAYPVPNTDVILETDSTNTAVRFLRSHSDGMNCYVLVSEKTLGKAACYYSTGQAPSGVTAGTYTGYYHALEVTESTAVSGAYTWQDYTASRTFTTQPYAQPNAMLAGSVYLAGDANNVPAAAAPVAGTKLTGTATLTRDATSGKVTAVTLKGDIQPLAAGQDKSTVDITAALTSTSTTQTVGLTGTLANFKGGAPTLTMSMATGSQIVGALATATANDHATSVNFVTQIKTTGFQYDGTLAMDTFVAEKGNGNYQPTNASFTGKISTLANGTPTEFMSGTLGVKIANMADFDSTKATSATNFLKETASFTGKVTNGATIYALTFIADGSTYGQKGVTLNYTRSGTQMVSVTGTTTDTRTELTISGTGNVNISLIDAIGDVKIGTTKVGSITTKNRVDFTDGTYLLFGV